MIECIKPVEIPKKVSSTKGAKIKIESDGSYLEELSDGSSKKLEKAKITLADCLACSGCITSAESILIEQQSGQSLREIFSSKQKYISGSSIPQKIIVVSLQIQPIISLANKYHLSVQESANKVCAYFKSLGADFVFDLKIPEDISLIEQTKEFVEQYQNKRSTEASTKSGKHTILTSACPGWICYAEKTHGSWILPYISRVKSGQQIMGSIVKQHLSKTLRVSSSDIIHVTVMPCFDKKLEASRPDFTDPTTGEKEVDLVITTVEIEQMLGEDGYSTLENVLLQRDKSIDSLAKVLKNSTNFEDIESNKIYLNHGSGSGGHAENVLVMASKELFGKEISFDDLKIKTLKNSDFKEIILENSNGEAMLRFAIANGFRNIQNLVQKMKRKKCSYDLVEVMACPSGCLNGGAQCKPSEEKDLSFKAFIAEMEKLYSTDIDGKCIPTNNPDVKVIYDDWLGGLNTEKSTHYLYTEYHEVEKMTNSLAIKW